MSTTPTRHDDAWYRTRLADPPLQPRVVIDTDAANEIDDPADRPYLPALVLARALGPDARETLTRAVATNTRAVQAARADAGVPVRAGPGSCFVPISHDRRDL